MRKLTPPRRQHGHAIARHAAPTRSSITAVARVTGPQASGYAGAMDVAIIGGTGAEGFGLTLRLANAGHHVTIGSRDADRAAAKAVEAREVLGPHGVVEGVENAAAAKAAPVVAVTVPFAGAAMIYETIGPAISA